MVAVVVALAILLSQHRFRVAEGATARSHYHQRTANKNDENDVVAVDNNSQHERQKSTTNTAAITSCIDLRNNCPALAHSGACRGDPAWMHPHCPVSCGVCDRRLHSNISSSQRMAPSPIFRRTPMMDALRTDFGVPQHISHRNNPRLVDAVRDRLDEAEEYMQETVLMEPRFVPVRNMCRLLNKDCVEWAVMGECEENQEFMTTECGPVCYTCENLHMEALCPIDPFEKHAWYPGDLNRMFEDIIDDPYYADQFDVTVLSRPEYAPGDTEDTASYQLGPWIVTLDNFLTPKEAQVLVDLGSEIGYERSTDVGDFAENGSIKSVVSTGRTSTNAWCNTPVCMENPTANALYARMQNVTKINRYNSEAFQLLRYEPGQFYHRHHDFIPHELSRKQGVRILTVFLYLNEVEEGGGTRFPGLGVTVQPKVGRALLWPSVLDEAPNEPDDRTDHEALKVEKGIKYGANVWIHQRILDDECE